MALTRWLAILKIRPEEAQMAALVALTFGLVDLGRAVGDSAADALFFHRFGVEYLPYLYIALGVLTFAASLGFAGFLGRFDKRRFFPTTLLGMALLLLVERAALVTNLRALYPLLWLSINVILTLLGTLLWTTAGEVCDARQAKRLFPLFVSASILGGLLGSLLIGPTARLLGTDNLILVFVLLLAGGALLIRRLARGYFPPARQPRQASTFIDDICAGFAFVKRSPLLQRLAVSAVLFSILYFSVSFPFGRAVSAAYPSEADLAGFLGLFKGVSSALMFVAALLVANRLYARIGIVNALLILPITYLLGFVIFAVYFSLQGAVIVRLAQFVVLSGIGDGAYSAFFNVVPPERRAQVRAFDSGVPAQIGVILSGILLILSQRLLNTTAIFFMGIVVAGMCAFVVWRMRRSYGEALVAALQAGRVEVFTGGERIFGGIASDLEAARILTGALSDPRPATQRLAAEMLARIGAVSAVPELIRRLPEVTAEVRAGFVHALGQLGAGQAAGPLVALLEDASPAVRCAALEELPRLSGPAGLEIQDTLRPRLADPDFAVRLQAATSLAQSGDAPAALSALLVFLQEASSERQCSDLLQAFGPALRRAHPAAGGVTGEAVTTLLRNLEDPAPPALRQAACQGLAGAGEPAALKALVSCLSDPAAGVRRAAAGSLRASGPAAVPLVLASLPAAPDPETVLEALPAGDPAISTPLRGYAQAALPRLREWRQASQALPRAGRVTRFLAFLLDTRAVQAEQVLLKVMGLLGNPAVMQLVARTLKTSDAGARAAAIEALDTLGDPQLVQAFLPLLEPASAGDRPGGGLYGQAEALLRRLIAGEDPWLRAVAILATGELNLTGLVPDVQRAAANAGILSGEAGEMTVEAGALTAEAARLTLNQFGGIVDTLATLSLVERTILLKDIPIFSDLAPEDLVEIAQTARERWFSDGEVLCREGEDGDELFIIAAGQVRVTKSGHGSEQVLATRQAGDFVGEIAIIDSTPRFATVTASGEARALVIGSEMFKAILRDRPEVSLAVLRGLSRRLREQH